MKLLPKKAAILDYSRCNARCNHCSRSAITVTDGISDEKILESIEYFKAHKVKSFHFSGREPILNPRIYDFIECAADIDNKGKPTRHVGIATNGFWGNEAEKRLIEFYQTGVRKITLSLDGIGKTHDEIRSFPGLYTRAMNIIENAVAFKKKVDDFIKLTVNVTAQKKNVNELETLVKYLSARLPEEFSTVLAFTTRYGRGANIKLAPEEIKKVNSVKTWLQGEKRNLNPYYFSFEKYEQDPSCPNYNKDFKRINLSTDGSVYFCPTLFVPYAVTLGNIREENLEFVLADYEKSRFYALFVNPDGKEKKRFLRKLDYSRYNGIRWSNKCLPCTILNTFVYFLEQGLATKQANDMAEKIAKGIRI
jgi:MoaA/NifB/PqqE/SkfB family radical SAM enzyme